MPYRATVLPVMISSPGDVLDYRNAAREIINDWNYINAVSSQIVLMPIAWETHSSPELGDRPQNLINSRLLKDCDLLVAVFWTRLGSPTGESESGTVEEVERHLEAGKPAMVYFSNAPAAPETIDREQFEKLTKFKVWCRSRGLIQEVENIGYFREQFSRQLPIALRGNTYLAKLISSKSTNDEASQTKSEYALSDHAIRLLSEAAKSKDGIIINAKTFSGHIIQTNDKTFGDGINHGSMARWDFAIGYLRDVGLIKERSSDGTVFEVTEKGYEIADHYDSLI